MSSRALLSHHVFTLRTICTVHNGTEKIILISYNTSRFWCWCLTLWLTEPLNFAHRLVFWKNPFRKVCLFSSSGESVPAKQGRLELITINGSFDIVTYCECDYIRGFGLKIAFADHFTVANFHILQITRTHAKSFPTAVSLLVVSW
jgi:hypothetical protein